jgi:uncharacterized membrane protein
MGIAALILGGLGLIVSLLPFATPAALFVSWLAWLFGIVALILGIISMVKSPKKTFGLIAIILAVLTFVFYFLAASFAVDSAVGDFEDVLNDPAMQLQIQQGMQEALQQPAQPVPVPAPVPTQ